MFKSKSFDLVNEERTKKPERLYQPRRMRWLKYIILPAVFGFVLLLILCNVDFSDTYEEICHDNNVSTLYVANYKFENNTLEKSFLSGSFRLKSLTIESGNLNYIANETFEQTSSRSLLSLQLLNIKLETLSGSALQGLQSLQNFSLINGHHSFRAFGFLAPVSKTLINARIHQLCIQVSYSLADFLGFVNFTSLKSLDLSGTNLGESLNGDSFNNIAALERLILRNCGLSQMNTFPINLKSLQYLDLSGNTLMEPSIVLKSMIWEYNIGKDVYTTAKTIINDKDSYILKELKSFDPGLVGATTTSTTTAESKTTSATSTPTPTPSTTTPSPRCEEELCEELAYTDPDGEYQIVAIPYDGILKFTDLGTNAVQSGGNFTMKISSLDCNTLFTFCLMIAPTITSPLNCQAHKTMNCGVDLHESWIDTNMGLVIGLGVAVTLIGCLLGMLIMYGTLWQKPTLLRCSKRLIQPNQESNTMFSMPAPGKCKEEKYDYTVSAIATVDNNEYIAAYHRYLKQANIRQTETNKYISPPRERAPSIPPFCNVPDIPTVLPSGINYEYESLDIYEELP
ncbi:hypothetical protein KR009_011314 [Drosophila setifemur]|nr:hypothetical protein KR009_011314 [Drosophila setifemur]